MSVTAAQAISNYNANHAIAAQVVVDTATALIAALPGLLPLQAGGNLSLVQLTGTANFVTAAQAAQLAALPRFGLNGAATMVVTDSAGNLLLPATAAGLTKATGVRLTGSAIVSAAQAKTLVTLKGFALATGATLVISDNAAGLLLPANATGLPGATGIVLTGANTVTASQATALAALKNFTLATGATLVVADNAGNLLAGGYAGGLALAQSIVLTGAGNVVTVAQALQLAALTGFHLASTARLVVADSAIGLLASGSAPAFALATQVRLTGTNAVNAAQAAQLSATTGFRLNSGATLVVSDSAAGLLAVPAARLAKATGVLLTGSNAVTAAQARALATIKAFALATGATLAITDSAANLLLLGNATGLTKATRVQVSGANVVSAAAAAKLAALTGLTLAAQATVQIADNAGNLLATANSAGLALATSVVLTGSGGNPVSSAQANVLVALPHFAVAAHVILTISDTASTLLSAAAAPGLAFATLVRLVANNVTDAAQATRLAALPGFHIGTVVPGTLTVIDNAANLLLAGNSTGIAVASTVELGSSATVNAAQATLLQSCTGFTLSNGAVLTVADSALAVTGALDALQALAANGRLSVITLTDGGAPTLMLTAAQYAGDAAAIGVIAGTFAIDVVGAAGATLTARAAGVTLDGSAGSQTLNACAAGGDTLIGGNGDTLTGGAGFDTFTFGSASGTNTIAGFVTSGTGADILQFSTSNFADYAHLLGASAQVGSDVVITLDPADTITLKNIGLANLTSANTRFV